MINTITRLEFKDVFPEEEPKDVLDYLRCASSDILFKIIGFLNTTPQKNYDDFFSNHDIQRYVIRRVKSYLKEYEIFEKPVIVTREASLRLAEIILAHRDLLLEDNNNSDVDTDELNIFKSFLIINGELNSRTKLPSSQDAMERIVDILISSSFPVADLGIFENNDLEFTKLIYATLERFEILLEFLQSKDDYRYLVNSLIAYFNQENTSELLLRVKELFMNLLAMKGQNGFMFPVADKKIRLFLDSLISEAIAEDEDFTNLKNYPIYKIDENTYSIIDYFFVVDKFVKSVKFILKEAYLKHHNLPTKDRSFFQFFNTEFSEKYLMKKILDQIFHFKYLVKKQVNKDSPNEPDYYIRYSKRIYLFENKDVLINKRVKSSGDIKQINDTLKLKFLKDGEKSVGIGQLVNSISQIIDRNFEYDSYVNENRNFTIYPILLVSDRIFEIPGMNFKLNQWYLDIIRTKLGEKYNHNFIKNLTIIDIDTLIYWSSYLVENSNNLRRIINDHLNKMNRERKISHPDPKVVDRIANIFLGEKLAPISSRFNNHKRAMPLLLAKFEELKS